MEIERVPGKYILKAESKDPERISGWSSEGPREFPFTGIKNEIDYFVKACQRHKQISESGFQRKVGFTDQYFPEISAFEGYKDVQYLLALFRAAETGSSQTVE